MITFGAIGPSFAVLCQVESRNGSHLSALSITPAGQEPVVRQNGGARRHRKWRVESDGLVTPELNFCSQNESHPLLLQTHQQCLFGFNVPLTYSSFQVPFVCVLTSIQPLCLQLKVLIVHLLFAEHLTGLAVSTALEQSSLRQLQ